MSKMSHQAKVQDTLIALKVREARGGVLGWDLGTGAGTKPKGTGGLGSSALANVEACVLNRPMRLCICFPP